MNDLPNELDKDLTWILDELLPDDLDKKLIKSALLKLINRHARKTLEEASNG